MFMPCQVAHFAAQSVDRRSAYLRENVLASDGISMSTLQEIYQKMYLRRFIEGDDYFASMAPGRRVTTALPLGLGPRPARAAQGRWRRRGAAGRHGDPRHRLSRWRDAIPRRSARKDSEGGDEIAVDDDYAALWDGPRDRSIFVQNAARGQKGLADPNLSLHRVAGAAHRQPNPRARVRKVDPLPSFIDWSTALAAQPAERITA
jgi:lysine N6-hydroxylase